MDKTLMRVRSMLSNHGVIELRHKTTALIKKFGYDGAQDYLQAQLYILRDLRNGAKNSGSDDNGNFD